MQKQNIVKQIAQELEAGFECYFNLKTEEIIGIPKFFDVFAEDELLEAFHEDLKKVEEQESDFIKFEVPESFESFKIMERFTAQLSDRALQAELEQILGRSKPFRNFKYRIDHSDVRQDWFAFRQQELEKLVEAELSAEGYQGPNTAG